MVGNSSTTWIVEEAHHSGGTATYVREEASWHRRYCPHGPIFGPHKDTSSSAGRQKRSLCPSRFAPVDIAKEKW